MARTQRIFSGIALLGSLLGYKAVTADTQRFTPARSVAWTNEPTIIFDMNGVLTKTSQIKAMRALEAKNIGKYLLFNWRSPKHVRKPLYRLMNEVIPGPITGARDPYGDLMPHAMCEWQKGTMTPQEILAKLMPHLEGRWNRFIFANKVEQEFAAKLAELMFSPRKLIDQMEINKDGVQFLKDCKKLGYRICILSNWDPESFALARKRFDREIFQYCDEVIVSGEVGMMKPEQALFQYTLALIGPNCIFIDDQRENVIAARNAGITTIQCTNPNFKKVRAEFERVCVKLPQPCIG